MPRMTKPEWREHNRAVELIDNGRELTWDERFFVLKNWKPFAGNDVGKGGAFFTPIELARLMHGWTPSKGAIVDICAGIGCLTLAIMDRNMWDLDKCRNEFWCVENNPDYFKVGQRLAPEAHWVLADCFAQKTWTEILKDVPGGKFAGAILNPPFGNVPTVKGEKNKTAWLNYRGVADLMACEIALRVARSAVAIIPQMHAKYNHSYGVNSGRRYNDNADYLKFEAANPTTYLGATCFDMRDYEEHWVGVKPKIELVYITEDEHQHGMQNRREAGRTEMAIKVIETNRQLELI